MSTLEHHVRTHTQQMLYEEIYWQNELLKYAIAWFCGFVNLCIENSAGEKRNVKQQLYDGIGHSISLTFPTHVMNKFYGKNTEMFWKSILLHRYNQYHSLKDFILRRIYWYFKFHHLMNTTLMWYLKTYRLFGMWW